MDHLHAELAGWFEHLRFVVDIQALRGGCGGFFEDEFVHFGIGFAHAGDVRKNAVLEMLQKVIGGFEIVDAVGRVVGQKQELVAGGLQALDEGDRSGDGLVGVQPQGREGAGGRVDVELRFGLLPKFVGRDSADAVLAAELAFEDVADGGFTDGIFLGDVFDGRRDAVSEVDPAEVEDEGFDHRPFPIPDCNS